MQLFMKLAKYGSLLTAENGESIEKKVYQAIRSSGSGYQGNRRIGILATKKHKTHKEGEVKCEARNPKFETN